MMEANRRTEILQSERKVHGQHWYKAQKKYDRITAWWYWRNLNSSKDRIRELERMPHWLADVIPTLDLEQSPLIKASIFEIFIHKVYTTPKLKIQEFSSRLDFTRGISFSSLLVAMFSLIISLLMYMK